MKHCGESLVLGLQSKNPSSVANRRGMARSTGRGMGRGTGGARGVANLDGRSVARRSKVDEDGATVAPPDDGGLS